MPLMLEHLLVCLIHNAIKASEQDNGKWYAPITITYDSREKTLKISNSGQPFARSIRNVFDTEELSELEARILNLYEMDEPRPGIGLVEAFCIARECYSGMVIDADSPSVTVFLCAT